MELGSNFHLDVSAFVQDKDDIKSYLAEEHTVYYDSGRSALRGLLKLFPKGKVLLPSYICKSVLDCFAGFETCYYSLDYKLEMIPEELEALLDENVNIVYIMHYFGKMQSTNVLEYIKEKKKERDFIIIEDTTHSFLTRKSTIGDYQICSLRKWLAIPDGGVVYTKTTEKLPEIPEIQNNHSGRITEAMILKTLFLERGIDTNRLYRNIFVQQEEKLDKQKECYAISDMSNVLLGGAGTKNISLSRKRNWNFVYQYLSNTRIRPVYDELTDGFVPFTFPVFVKERDRFRQYLMEHKIYCALHWPMETEEQKKIDVNRNIEKHMISLPIDQRYEEDAIRYMIKIVNKFK